jgi:hypothetical protein
LFEAVGKIPQSFRSFSESGDRFDPDLWNHGVIHVLDCVAQFHLNQFDGLFNPSAHASRARWWI